MRSMKLAVLMAASLTLPVPALAKTFKVSEYKKSGIYEQEIGDFRYLHDTVAGLCFFLYTDGNTAAGLTTVDCSSVTKRPEWSNSLKIPVPASEVEESEATAEPEASKTKTKK